MADLNTMKSRTEFEEQKRLAWDLQNRIEDVMFQNVVDGHKLEALYPDVYRNVHEYGMGIDIAKGVFGIYQGASNHEELHNLMKATIMIRRLKKEVLSELPLCQASLTAPRACLVTDERCMHRDVDGGDDGNSSTGKGIESKKAKLMRGIESGNYSLISSTIFTIPYMYFFYN
ncbi:hypothetical protein Syun_014015 [Stephania yunnanensis]|uniref:Uncharacterized protein n=1 Tax=Stephania yunnanensis TaxID=152371 RepID=A0AAP0JKM0_9MAGN